MPTRIDSFTPLQSLLLFQSIALHGTDHQAFDTISTKLKQNEHFCGATDSVAPVDISPDTLKDAYLALLKEEAKRELIDARDREDAAQNGPTQTSSPRKRKLPSPIMPTIEEARKHMHLIPRIIPKLYANYRDRVIEDIRYEEKTYDGLVKEIKDLERINNIPKQQDPHPQHAVKPTAAQTSPKSQHPAAVQPLPSPDQQRPVSRDAARASAEVRKNDTRIDTIINHDPPQEEPSGSDLPSAATTLASQPATSAKATLPQIAPAQRGPSQIGSPYENVNGKHAGASPVSTQSPHARPSSTHSQSPTFAAYPPHRQNPVVVLPNPAQGTNTTARGPSFPATSPYGTAREPTARPAGMVQQPANTYPPQPPYVLPADQYARHQQPPVGPPYQQPRPPIGVVPQTQNVSPYPTQPPFLQTAPHSSRVGGVMLPPFQVQPPSGPGSSQSPRPAQSPSQHTSQYPQQTPSRPQVKTSADPLRLRTSEITGPQTPVRQSPASALNGPSHNHLQQRRNVLQTPGSTTLWKALPFAPAATPGASRPDARDISPISDSESRATPVPPIVKANKKEGKRPVGRPRQSRGPSKTPSIAVSSGQGRTRSQSILSHADEMSVDDRASIKNEVDTSTADDTEIRIAKPQKRGGNKRKRADTAEVKSSPARDTPLPAEPYASAPPQTVLCVKDFKKIALPILANIRGHKHGSIFESPIKERDAEGYHEIIKRPQDFKSIEKALGYGTRAIRQALAGEQGSPGAADSNTVTLPISEDLVPPKAIVNPAQLETEIMRTFANAVMFNPGEDELVEDTREMFEHALTILNEWRQNEKPDGDTEESAIEDEGSAGATKRRRL